MLAIIAHHYVVNSSVRGLFAYDGTATPQQYFLEVWGMWGKTGINAFILISGYFMCRMQLTARRYVKLLIQILFYGITIMLIFAICDYQQLTIRGLFNKLFGLLTSINNGFAASFMAFYIFVPFYNKLISVLTKRQLGLLVLGLLFIMTICSTVFLAPTMNEPVWYMTLYFVAAYIRLYPNKWTDNLKLSSIVLTVSILVAVAICIAFVYLANHTGRTVFSEFKWHLVSDSNKLLAFLIGLSAFLTAKNFNMGHSKTVNFLAAGCFGVLLIHASSDTMRHWLWQDICDVPGMLHAELPALIAQAVAVPIIIFLICSFIDHYYKKFLEPVFMNLIFNNKTGKK
ncbi:MAG: acyltransferase family protein [Barnesiella sp.]|nr:acyltransferase family protein [Bacteroidales bacterium]MBD5247267.1 acyltransferase family protein [Barnesiella sp.]